MGAVAHIQSAMSAPWCGWTMLVLLLCAVLAEVMQPGVITQTPAALLARTDRTYKESPTNFIGQLFVTLFRLGTVAMSLCVCLFPADRASFTAFGAICGIIVAVLLVKMLCNVLLDYTFSLTRRFGNPYEQYGNIATLSAAILYPVLLVILRVPDQRIAWWAVGTIAVLFLCIWLFRAARTFVMSLSSLLYLIIYMATLEIFPIATLIYLSAKTITIL